MRKIGKSEVKMKLLGVSFGALGVCLISNSIPKVWAFGYSCTDSKPVEQITRTTVCGRNPNDAQDCGGCTELKTWLSNNGCHWSLFDHDCRWVRGSSPEETRSAACSNLGQCPCDLDLNGDQTKFTPVVPAKPDIYLHCKNFA